MAALPEPRILFLEELEGMPVSPGRLPGGWSFGIGRIAPAEFLVQVFRWNPGSGLPRGYRESVLQRHSLWAGLGGPASAFPASLEEEDEGLRLAVSVPDGESLPSYLGRVPALSEDLAWRFCLDLVAWLKVLAPSPRLLSNVEPDDFLVNARDGVSLELLFCPVPAMIREEAILGDHQIARVWTENLSRLHAFFKGGKDAPFGGSSPGSRLFRPLLKELDAGRERSLEERLEEIAALFRKERAAVDRKGRPAGGGSAFPIEPAGPFARYLRSRARLADPDRFGETPLDGAGAGFCSLYEVSSRDGTRSGKLLPPERWFDRSLIGALNRRLSHPFAKTHPQCPRVRAVYCDERLTLLTGDPGPGLPLPALLTMKDGLTVAEWYRLTGKLHRVLSQFESAGFLAGLETPWQIEVQPGGGPGRPGWDRLAGLPLEEWPAWEVLVRVERTSESFLSGGTNHSWQHVWKAMDGKFFPALLAWGLDWKRFQWAARTGILDREPLSWDSRLLVLFEAARDHLDVHSSKQREKFLALLEEGLESG